jgi:uncharacterized protein
VKQNRLLFSSTIISVMLLVAATSSFAVGLDCTRAKSQTEQAVCASNDLRQQDEKLSLLYHRLLGCTTAATGHIAHDAVGMAQDS